MLLLTWESEAGGQQWVQGQRGLYSELKANLNNIARPCLKKQQQKKPSKTQIHLMLTLKCRNKKEEHS